MDSAAVGRMHTFCARILKTLAPPLLREFETVKARTQEALFVTPRRSARITKPGAPLSVAKSKKASAAEAVLLNALGLSTLDLAVDDSALQEFKHLFDSPLKEQHVQVLAAVFGKSMPQGEELALSSGGMVSVH